MKKNIWKRILSLALALVMVVGLLPMTSMTAHAATAATYTDGVYVLEVTNYDEYMQTGEHVRSIELLGIENVDISINTSNQIVCSFKLRFIDAIGQERTTDYSFSFTVENKSCTEAISHPFEATYGKGSSTTYVVTKGTLTRAARTEHTGGTATCVAKAKCSVCGEEYGDYGDHSWGDWTYSNGKHSRTCTLDGTHTESANCTRGENDRCTVCETNLVASLTSGDTTTYYETVDEAFAAAQAAGSGTVTVLANAEYTREETADAITYSKNISLVVNPNVTLTTEAFLRLYGSISGGGTIAGTNQGWLVAYGGSTIDGITATVRLKIAGGTILSGTFAGEVQNEGTIKGGTFSGMVYNSGTIEGGTFNKTVVNHDYYSERMAGTISGGTFNCTVENTPGTINGGTFNGQLTNKPYSEHERYVEATVDADNLMLGENFSFTNQGGTVNCTTHQRRLPVTCKECAKCIFCGNIEGDPDPTAHSLSYAAADNVITETCAHGCADPATATLETNTGSVTYNGAAQTIEASVTHSATWRGERLTAQYKNNTDVGTATVYIQAGEAKAEKTFEITRATPTLEHFDITLPQNAVYDGSEKAATVTLASPYSKCGEITVEYYNGETKLDGAPTDAGTYTVKFRVAEGDNFNAMDLTEAGSFTITKADPICTAPTANTLTYNGEDQTLIAAGATNDGTMVYSLEKEGEYKAELPKAKTAGTYHVWYKVIGDGNHTDSAPASVEVKIDKADPGIGAVTAGVVENTLEPGAIVLNRTNSDIPGTLAVDAEQILVLGENKVSYTFTPTDGTNYELVKGEVTVTVVDTTAPTGTVTVSTNSWAEFLNNITFGLFFKETQTVSVTAEDNLSGVAKIEYIESATPMNMDAVKAATQWTEMSNGSVSVTLEDTKQFACYIRITDKAGNVTFLSSDGAEYDTAAPVIEGVDNGATYYTTQAVTVTDKNIDTITLNGEAVTGSISLAGNKEATYTIVATDKAGNTTTVTVKMTPIADNVTPDNKSDLEQAKADLEKALEDNSGNYTEEEKQAIQDEIDHIDDALKVIENVEAVEDVISALPATVEPDDEETVEKIEDAKKAYDELTEYEKSLVDDDTKKKLDDLTAAAVAYKIVKGDNGKWTKGSTSGLSFTANGPLGKFSGIEIDGKVIDAKHYDAVTGSTVITLKASYLETLSVGTHTITVVYTDGEAEGTFQINPKSVTPATGDNFNILLWTSVMIVSLAAIAVLLIEQKKRRYVK